MPSSAAPSAATSAIGNTRRSGWATRSRSTAWLVVADADEAVANADRTLAIEKARYSPGGSSRGRGNRPLALPQVLGKEPAVGIAPDAHMPRRDIGIVEDEVIVIAAPDRDRGLGAGEAVPGGNVAMPRQHLDPDHRVHCHRLARKRRPSAMAFVVVADGLQAEPRHQGLGALVLGHRGHRHVIEAAELAIRLGAPQTLSGRRSGAGAVRTKSSWQRSGVYHLRNAPPPTSRGWLYCDRKVASWN